MMHALLEQPETQRLLKSVSVALPFDREPFAILAAGLRTTEDAVRGTLAALQEAGLIDGLWGEPNPGLAEAHEVLQACVTKDLNDDLAPGTVIRWQAVTGDGTTLRSVMALGAPPGPGFGSVRFAKCGFPLSFTEGEAHLLLPSSDRTYQVGSERVPFPPFAIQEAQVADRFLQPVRWDFSRPFWETFAAETGLSAEDGRLAARKAVLAHVWRRFAFRSGLLRHGWEGIGLARWDFRSSGEAQQAAEAISAIQVTGDVVVRSGASAGEGPFYLEAVFLARPAGAGERAARRIAVQWGLPLNEWRDLGVTNPGTSWPLTP